MVLHFKIKFTGFSPAQNLQVIFFAGTFRHLCRWQIRSAQQQFFQFQLGLFGLLSQHIQLPRYLFQRRIHLSLGVIHTHTLANQGANLFRGTLALCQQVLTVYVRLLASGVQYFEVRHIEGNTASGQCLGDAFRVLPDRLDIQHPANSCFFINK